MKQSRLASWIETILSTATGFVVSLGIQFGICWWFGLPLELHDNLAIIGVFTVASLLRQYGWRRLMEALHVRRPLSPFVQAVIAERYRQIEGEGWDFHHDDAHETGDLASAGASYAHRASLHLNHPTFATDRLAAEAYCPNTWPWDLNWWKPTGFRRDLVKAAALIIAEGEKFDRRRRRA